MHIDSLKYFFQVANSKSISTVAKNAHISQSALSQQIAKLENKLNVQLFNRTNKGVFLTSEGEILFKYAESILTSYNKMQEELINSINNKKNIYIESVEAIGLTVLPMAISRLKKHFSSYTINLNTIDSSNSNSNSNLLNNLCDIFICYTKPETSNGITAKLIGNDEFFLVADRNFPVNTLKKEEIFNIPLIISSDKNSLKTLICDEFNCDNVSLDDTNILYNTNSYFSALKGISSSKAATFIPSTIYNNCNSLYNIKKIKVDDLSLKIPIYINYSDSFYKTNSEFVKSIKNILKSYLN